MAACRSTVAATSAKSLILAISGSPEKVCVPARSPPVRLADHLLPRPERRHGLRLPAPRPCDGRAQRRRPPRQLLAQPGLPDAGLARHEHQLTATSDGRAQSALQLA